MNKSILMISALTAGCLGLAGCGEPTPPTGAEIAQSNPNAPAGYTANPAPTVLRSLVGAHAVARRVVEPQRAAGVLDPQRHRALGARLADRVAGPR